MSAAPINTNKKNSFAALAELRVRWQQIEPRTRTLLLISAGALLAGLIYAYVWLPAQRGRVQNAERIPVLEARLATMRAQVAELQRLNTVPSTVPPAASASVTNTSARSVADVNGLQAIFGASAKIQRDENRLFRITIASIGYPSFLDRLDQALSRYRLNVETLDITALSGPISATTQNTKTNLPVIVSVEVALVETAAAR
jgi:type II secretory pathway component PulM